MTDQEIRVKIATFVGWTRIQMGCRVASGKQLLGAISNLMGTPPCDKDKPEDDQGWEIVPDYCNDLNAIHEAERFLGHALGFKYREALCIGTMNAGGPIHATAKQRSDAFVLAIGGGE